MQKGKAAVSYLFYLCPLVTMFATGTRFNVIFREKRYFYYVLLHINTTINLKLFHEAWYMLPLTFCLSSIFMAKYCSVPLCFTSMTLPNEPVPRVFNLSKSSRHVVLCENSNMLAYSVDAATKRTEFKFSSFSPVAGIPISVRNLLWLWLETLSLKKSKDRYT